MNIGIMGNYRCHDIVKPYLGHAEKRREKDRLDDELRRSDYFRGDSVAYEFFQNKYPGTEVTIVPCQAKHPYKEKKKYTPGDITYLKVTITREDDLTIFILHRT